ncbi:hypothetical protein Bca4012_059088 [Brassica carinata]
MAFSLVWVQPAVDEISFRRLIHLIKETTREKNGCGVKAERALGEENQMFSKWLEPYPLTEESKGSDLQNSAKHNENTRIFLSGKPLRSQTMKTSEGLLLDINSSEDPKTPFSKRKEEDADLPDLTSSSKKMCTKLIKKEKPKSD